MKLRSAVKAIVILSTILLNFQIANGQSRSSIGVRYGINMPFSDVYGVGTGFAFQGNIAIGSKWGFETAVVFEHLNSNENVYYDNFGYEIRRQSDVDLIELSFAARHYFNGHWFARGGIIPYLALGNEDLLDGGISVSVAAGYQHMLDNRNRVEFTLNTDFIDLDYRGNNITPVAGLKVAYQFNFRK